MTQRGEKALAEVIKKIVPGLKPTGGDRHRKICLAWEETIGPEKAGSTKVTMLKRGTLHVEVESPSLLQELTCMNINNIAEKMQERLQDMYIKDIKLKLAKD